MVFATLLLRWLSLQPAWTWSQPGRASAGGFAAPALACAALLAAGCGQSTPPAAPVAPPPDVPGIKAKAEQGDAKAQRLLGDLLLSGQGVTQDYKEALRWFEKSAAQGDSSAANHMGELREAGQGGPPSFVEAEKWYRKGAEAGNASAQYNLAVLYAFGRGVRLNENEAVRWYKAAAEQGHALAQFNLGQRYQLGKGVAADSVEAFKWLSLAAATIEDSGKFRDELKGHLTRQQLAEARERIAAFRPHPASP